MPGSNVCEPWNCILSSQEFLYVNSDSTFVTEAKIHVLQACLFSSESKKTKKTREKKLTVPSESPQT